MSACRPVINVSDKLNFAAIRRADGLFAPSKMTAKITQKVINRECVVLETPTMKIDKDRLRDLPESLKGKKYFLYFGSLNNFKGLRVIIQSIHRILEENPLYYFVMIGKDCGVSFHEGMRTPVVGKMKEEAGEYQVDIITSPFNSVVNHRSVNIMVQDRKVELLSADFGAGDYNDARWCEGVLNQERKCSVLVPFNKGLNELKLEALEAGVVLERILIHKPTVKIPESYLGPEESYMISD